MLTTYLVLVIILFLANLINEKLMEEGRLKKSLVILNRLLAIAATMLAVIVLLL